MGSQTHQATTEVVESDDVTVEKRTPLEQYMGETEPGLGHPHVLFDGEDDDDEESNILTAEEILAAMSTGDVEDMVSRVMQPTAADYAQLFKESGVKPRMGPEPNVAVAWILGPTIFPKNAFDDSEFDAVVIAPPGTDESLFTEEGWQAVVDAYEELEAQEKAGEDE